MALAFSSSTTPHHLALVLVLLLLTVFTPFCFAKKCHVDDEAGLLAFKSGFTQNRPPGILSSWIPGTDCCKSWFGINCDADRVTSLYLYEMFNSTPSTFLTGTISPSLFTKVGGLTSVHLENFPYITGTLPKDLFNLPNLQYVHISNTKLSGPLGIDKDPKSVLLSELTLNGNQFTGSIPNSIAQFSNLRVLYLSNNKFSGGIPYGIERLKKLEFVYLQYNQLSGVIPNIFKSLRLVGLQLSNNKLSGEIPPSVSFLAPQLELFNASHNALTGKIPNYFKDLEKLHILDLSYNQLSGQIPTTKFKFGAEAFAGNGRLCGSPLPPCKNKF